MSRTKSLIDELIQKKANNDAFQVSNIKIKLILKGIFPDSIDENTVDDPELIAKIYEVADQFNITLSK